LSTLSLRSVALFGQQAMASHAPHRTLARLGMKGGAGWICVIQITSSAQRRHESPRIVGDLLNAEIAEKQARSIKYQLTIAKLPLAKDIADFDFAGTPINEARIRDLAGGAFIAEQRNAVLVGGTGTGKSHLAIAIARKFADSPLEESGFEPLVPPQEGTGYPPR